MTSRQSQTKPRSTKKPVIKPPKGFTAGKQADFVFRVRIGGARIVVAKEMGLNGRQIFDFIDKSDDFREKVEQAETQAVESALFEQAMDGKTIAQKTWLEMRGVKKSTHAGAGFEPEEEKPVEPENPIAKMANVTPLRGTGRAKAS
jgi:hypothetical protein